MPVHSRNLVCSLAGLGISLMLVLASAGAPPEAAPATPPAAPPKDEAPQKKIAFEMRDKPWSAVLEWLSDQSGMPFISNFKPAGTFTFVAPKSGQRAFTIPEIIDILNEALVSKKFILIRRSASFTCVPADQKIDPAILPRVGLNELDKHGNTELVSVVLPLNSLVAEDLVLEVKKMLGPFGEAVAMANANQLVMQDTAGNIRRIVKTIKDIEENEKGQAESFSQVCKYIKARDAAKVCRELLGDPREMLRAAQAQVRPPGGRGGPPQQPQPQVIVQPKIRMHYISFDERTNTVLVTGPANKIAQAREILKKLDVPQPHQAPVLVGPPILKTYQVPSGGAEAIVKTLQDIYKSSPTIRISSIGNNQILVWAGPDDQFEIAKHIIGTTDQNATTELLPMTTLDAAKTADTLKGMFGEPKSGGPYIEADTQRNSIIVKGTRGQVSDVKAALKAIGEGDAASTATMRVITINQGSTSTLAEALERLLPQMRKNPVRVIMPGKPRSEEPKPAAPDKKAKPPADTDSRLPAPGSQAASALLVRADDRQLVDPKENKKPKKDDRPGKADAPVTITAFGNRLIITSEDPAALALVQELVRLLTQNQGGEGDFEIIKLKNASATEAARILDEAFNGSKQQPQQQPAFGGFFGRFGGRGATAPTNPAANRVRIVADPATNSLLVRANPLDMLTIRNLLEKAIDSGSSDSMAVMKTWIIGPLKYATAKEVASVVRDVYRDSINPNRNSTQVLFGGFGRRSAAIGNNPNIPLKDAALSVGVDDRSNSLVLSCSQALYEDVKKLVDQMELAAKDSARTIRVISIKGIDPALVQQAVDAIQGRKPNPQRNNNQRGNFGRQLGSGGNQQGGFQQGGFQRMGGGNPGGGQPGGFRGSNPPASSGPAPGFRGSNPPPGSSGGSRGTGPPGPRSSASPPGRDFFVDRVKDDPQQTLLYDPHLDESPLPDTYEQEEQLGQALPPPLTESAPAAPAGPPAAVESAPVRGPRAPVTAEALPELDVIVISGNNPADVDEIIKIIEYIQRMGAGSEVEIRIVPLERADATSVTNTLLQLFQQVVITPGTVRSANQQPSAGESSVVLIPLPRYNAILMAAPKARVNDVIKEIQRLDLPVFKDGRTTPFPLKKASAARVAALLQQFYAQRYPNESAGQDQIRFTYDDSSNTVFVQAAPADLAEIRGLIERIDSNVSPAVNDMRIVPLKNALSDELTNLLMQAIAQGFTPTGTTGAPGIIPSAAGLRPGGLTTTLPVQGGQPNGATKSTSLRFMGGRGNAVESGFLDDIRITSDSRTNSLIISAPKQTMDLLLSLVHELDVPPAARAEVKIFTLKRADANAMANTLQQLFLGTGSTTGAAGVAPVTAGGTGGLTGLSSAAGGFPGAAGLPRPLLVLGGLSPDGAPLIDLRLTIDARTNSVIIAGSRHDLQVIEAVISRLEDSDVQARKNEVYHLRNAAAADVATALQNFLTRSLQVISQGQQLTAFQEIQRDVVIVPEPVSNTLMISATPQYFTDLMNIILELDAAPPQVVIQVLIAEVDLDNAEEFGMEVGLQSPILFSRTVIPQTTAFGPNGSVTYTTPTTGGTGLVPPGVTVNNSLNPAALPGYGFNTTAPLGNNPLAGPGIVGFQGINNLGVGRASANNANLGGFVFSAASDAFTLLIRALKTQNRLDILSRPQIMTLDNQSATILVGQSFPYATGTNSSFGVVTLNVNYRNIGVELDVTPRISPEGKVIMRVKPQISSAAPGTLPLGNGFTAQIFNVQTVDTTVVAADGETVAIGGLISKNDTHSENKIPWLGDLPYVGACFRYRNHFTTRRELLVILTPHIVRSCHEKEKVLADESKRIDWVLSDVMKVHATTGMEPVLQGANDKKPDNWFRMHMSKWPKLFAAEPEPEMPAPASLMPPADAVPTDKMQLPDLSPQPGQTLPPPRRLPAPPAPGLPGYPATVPPRQ